MSPALVCSTIVCAALLSIADAALFDERSARALQDKPAKSWPEFSIYVWPEGTSVSASYTMTAKPVFSDDEKYVLYDLYARFDESLAPGIDKSIMSYRQTDGYTTVMSRHGSDQFERVCLNSTLPAHRIPPINAIVQGLMSLEGDASSESGGCSEGYNFMVGGEVFVVCNTIPGSILTITGDNMYLNVTYSDSVFVATNGGAETGCLRVAKPIAVTNNFGKSLLDP